jgi:hypothetical protein
MTHCYVTALRAIWVKYKPSDLDLFDQYSATVTRLATEFHNGDISHEAYQTGRTDAGAALRAKAVEKHRIQGD